MNYRDLTVKLLERIQNQALLLRIYKFVLRLYRG